MLAVAAGAALAVGGLVGGSIVLAQDGGQAANGFAPGQLTNTANQQQTPQETIDEFLSSVAQKLNVDVQTLKDAIKQTGAEFVDRAAAEGKIDQATADKIKQAIESESLGGLLPGIFDHHMGKRGGSALPFFMGELKAGIEDLAAWLGNGVTPATIRTEMMGGKSLAEIAADHGKSRDELKGFLTQEFEERLGTAVANGRITQAQADRAKQEFTERLDEVVDASMMGRGAMPFGGMPFGGRHMHGDGDSEDSDGDLMPGFMGSGMPGRGMH
jgi:hypothetical protein